jgi:hypothetical protein
MEGLVLLYDVWKEEVKFIERSLIIAKVAGRPGSCEE